MPVRVFFWHLVFDSVIKTQTSPTKKVLHVTILEYLKIISYAGRTWIPLFRVKYKCLKQELSLQRLRREEIGTLFNQKMNYCCFFSQVDFFADLTADS